LALLLAFCKFILMLGDLACAVAGLRSKGRAKVVVALCSLCSAKVLASRLALAACAAAAGHGQVYAVA
jgi:hypothetical protein